MKAPQTRAEIIGKFGCLAMCYAYCLGIEPEFNSEYIRIVSDAMDKGILDDECTVLDAGRYLQYLSGKKWNVQKCAIDNPAQIAEIKDRTPVRFDYNGYSHWVVVENGEVVFNSLEKSNCVNFGKPVTMRVITLA